MSEKWEPRTFQVQDRDLADDILAGNRPRLRIVLNDITPGGGKSKLPVIFGRLLPGLADKIAWFAPRSTLVTAGEEAFEGHQIGRWLGKSLRIRASGNEIDPSRGTSGYISTHQAVAANPELHLAEFQRHRYILVIDEPHHIEVGSILATAFAPLVERSRLTILMTGTLGRHDRRRVAFVKYELRDGRERPVYESTDDTYEVIRYSRQEALSERAIIPIEFAMVDFKGSWETNGKPTAITSFNDVSIDNGASEALTTALNTDYATQLLDRCVKDWMGHRRDNPRAQLLIAAHSQAAAKRYAKYVRQRFGQSCGIAVIDEGQQAKADVDAFRSRALAALATVGMAYEGMDAPSVTHIAVLCRFRSEPWIEQLLARGSRYDRGAGPWHQQKCYAYVPDDPLMKRVVARIKAEQAPYIIDPDGPGHGPGPQPSDVIPLSGMSAGHRSVELSGDSSLSRDVTMQHQAVIDSFDLSGRITPLLLDQILKHCQDQSREPVQSPPLTVSQEEDKRRTYLQSRCARLDRRRGVPWGTTNGDMLSHFKKSRTEMNLNDLKAAGIWLEMNWPLELDEELWNS